METSDLGSTRHDLKNVLTALRSGCMLIESRLAPGGQPEVREILEEMRMELERGATLLERLRDVGRSGKTSR